jgi:hypothetical protein
MLFLLELTAGEPAEQQCLQAAAAIGYQMDHDPGLAHAVDDSIMA